MAKIDEGVSRPAQKVVQQWFLHSAPEHTGPDHTSEVMRVATTAASVSARRVMIATSCSGDLPGPQMTSGNPVLAARQVSTWKPATVLADTFNQWILAQQRHEQHAMSTLMR